MISQNTMRQGMPLAYSKNRTLSIVMDSELVQACYPQVEKVDHPVPCAAARAVWIRKERVNPSRSNKERDVVIALSLMKASLTAPDRHDHEGL